MSVFINDIYNLRNKHYTHTQIPPDLVTSLSLPLLPLRLRLLELDLTERRLRTEEPDLDLERDLDLESDFSGLALIANRSEEICRFYLERLLERDLETLLDLERLPEDPEKSREL